MNKNFCTEYRILTEKTEIPPTFNGWCSLIAISMALGRRVFLDMGPFRIYPNMYVVLVGASGNVRKSTGLAIVRNLLNTLKPPPQVIPQKITPQKLVESLKTNAVACLLTDELTNFLNAGAAELGMLTLLTEFYDCADKFETATLGRGKETLTNTQMGILACTTPEELRKAVSHDAIGSGLTSRFLFVYETQRGEPVTFPTYIPRQLEARQFCSDYLQSVLAISGQVVLNAECRAWCEKCYNERCYNSPMLQDPNLAGYASRRFTHILKLATVLSVGTRLSLELDLVALTTAERLLEHNEDYLYKIIRILTMNDKGATLHFVLSLINRFRKIERHQLMALTSHRIDTRELTDIIETLRSANQVRIMSDGSHIYYQDMR